MVLPTRAELRLVWEWLDSLRRLSAVREIVTNLHALAEAVLDAPEEELPHHRRALWGECSVCGVANGVACEPQNDDEMEYGGPGSVHAARLVAAPTRVRRVPVA